MRSKQTASQFSIWALGLKPESAEVAPAVEVYESDYFRAGMILRAASHLSGLVRSYLFTGTMFPVAITD